MRALLFLAMASLLAPALPVHADAPVRERNVHFVLRDWPGYDPQAWGTLHTTAGTEVHPAGALLAMVLDRMGDVDMAALAASSVNGAFPAAGDVWLYEQGEGSCPEPQVLVPAGTPREYVLLGDQFWLYGGPEYRTGLAATNISLGGFGLATEWLTKTSWLYSEAVTYSGNSDFFCFEVGGFAVHFPYLDGVASES